MTMAILALDSATAAGEERFKLGMRRLAGAVCVITTAGAGGERNGLTATAVTSVTASPPTLLCCINKSASAFDTIRETSRFVVNVVAAADRAIAARFAGGESGEPRFAGGRWSRLETGAPVLETALAAFDCRVSEIAEIGSHGIVFGEVSAVQLAADDAAALLYRQGCFGSFTALPL